MNHFYRPETIVELKILRVQNEKKNLETASQIMTIHHFSTATATAKSLQSCPTLCDPIPGMLQARVLEWVAVSFSNA